MILYGIKNCDTVTKARRWLADNHIDFQFHDLRTDGIEQSLISTWLTQVSWQDLLNKRSTTWRKLAHPDKDHIDETIAIELMLSNPTLIKRPILSFANEIVVGFNENNYQTHFGK